MDEKLTPSLRLHSKFEASLGYIKLCLRTTTNPPKQNKTKQNKKPKQQNPQTTTKQASKQLNKDVSIESSYCKEAIFIIKVSLMNQCCCHP